MKGLVYNDLLTAWKTQRWVLLVSLALDLALLLWFRAPDINYFWMLTLSFVVVNSYKADEKGLWTVYLRTLPVTPGQIAGSKYLANACFLVPGAVLAYLALRLTGTSSGPAAALTTVLVDLCGMQVLFCVMMPLCFRYGRRVAARIVAAAVVVLSTCISTPLLHDGSSRLVEILNSEGTAYDALVARTARLGPLAWWPAILGMAAVYGISFWYSERSCQPNSKLEDF